MIIDLKEIEGTNCYLDESVYPVVRDIINSNPIKDIHFLGSGNYHYLSYFWLDRITIDFSLLLFDNHPDMQRPAFSDILSCGGWVLKSLEDFIHLKQVYICGASKEHILEESPMPKKVSIINDMTEINIDLPLYISIDKDVLSCEYAITDWDQGIMSDDELCNYLKALKNIEILGVDICGDSKEIKDEQSLKVNKKVDEKIEAVLRPLLSN